MKTIVACAAAAFLMVLFATAVDCQQQTQDQKVNVRLRLLPFTVTDERDQPVTGLKPEDFELLIDGAPVAIRSLDERDYRRVRSQVREGRQPEIGDLPPRRIVFLFDTLSSSLQEADAAVYRAPGSNENVFAQRTADTRGLDDGDAEAFLQRGTRNAKIAAGKAALEQLLPTDEVAVIEVGFSPRLLQSFTADRQKVKAAIEQLNLPGNLLALDSPAIDESDPNVGEALKIQENRYLTRRHMMRVYTNLQMTVYRNLAEILADLPGSKQVILFSEGFPVQEHKDEANKYEVSTDYQTIINKISDLSRITGVLASSGTRVHTLSLAGMEKSRLKSPQESSLASIALETGGQYFPPRTRLEGALEQALNGLDSYYELFFTPLTTGDGEFHPVEVRVKRPGLRVRAPKGFYDERQFDQSSATARQASLDRAFWQPLLANDLGAEFQVALLPCAASGGALHVRALLPEFTIAGESAITATMLFGQNNEWYDQASWRVPANLAGTGQIDLLVALPPGTFSYQVALQTEAGGQALHIGAYEVPSSLPETLVGPIFFSGGREGAEPQADAYPAKLNHAVPEPLRRMVRETAVREAAGGDIVTVWFVYRGAAFHELYLQLTQGENQVQTRALEFGETVLAEDLRIVSGKFEVPAWPAGPLEVLLAAPVGEKVYRLGSASLTVGH